MKPSKYQQAIYDFIDNGKGNAVVNAVAGSGKSTTLVGTLDRIPESKQALFVAFNKDIVEELILKVFSTKEKINDNRQNALKEASSKMRQSNVNIQTLHSLGFSMIRYKEKGVILDERKYRDFLKENFSLLYPGSIQQEQEAEFITRISQLVDLGRVNLCTDTNQIYDIALKHGIEVVDFECEVALKTITWGKRNMKRIDFTDMIYLPVANGLTAWAYDFVFIDECQDLNACQRALFLKTVKPTYGRFVAVGDPRQAIYGFAGADAESFDALRNLPKTIELPLSVCYRCDQSIINISKEIVSQIEARENAPEGVVNSAALLSEIQVGDMVLCRMTAPLIDICYKFISTGIPAYIKGRDIGSNLIKMIEKSNKKTIKTLFDHFEFEKEKMINNVMRKIKCTHDEAVETNMVQAYVDKIKCIEMLSDNCKTVKNITDKIESIFKDDSKGVILSTVHRSKGLENDRVFIACPEMLPLIKKGQKEWQRAQEVNLQYVAYTRAKNYLGFISDYTYKK